MAVAILSSTASHKQESRLYTHGVMGEFNAIGWIFSMKTPRQRAGGFSFTAMLFWVAPSQPTYGGGSKSITGSALRVAVCASEAKIKRYKSHFEIACRGCACWRSQVSLIT